MSGSSRPFPYARIGADFTPFRAHSNEPRFAVETPFTDEGTVRQALLWAGGGGAADSRRYHGCADEEGKWLAVCVAGSFADASPVPLSDRRLFSGLSAGEAALAIRDWLEERADYGEPPWFDGGEERGMRMFQVAYRQEPARFYGWTVVQPHWFEVHK